MAAYWPLTEYLDRNDNHVDIRIICNIFEAAVRLLKRDAVSFGGSFGQVWSRCCQSSQFELVSRRTVGLEG